MFLDGASRSVLSQLKLPTVGIFRRILLKEKRSMQQWLLICCITVSVWGSILSTVESQASMERVHEILGPGLGLGLICVGFSSCAGLAADVLMKKTNQEFIIQVAQIRLTSMLVVLIIMIGYACWMDEMWKLVFYGWNWNVVGLVSPPVMPLCCSESSSP